MKRERFSPNPRGILSINAGSIPWRTSISLKRFWGEYNDEE
jgi:hypothetical protein